MHGEKGEKMPTTKEVDENRSPSKVLFTYGVDAVEVVRCKDCFHFWDGVCKAHNEVIYVDENDFCSFGERRED